MHWSSTLLVDFSVLPKALESNPRDCYRILVSNLDSRKFLQLFSEYDSNDAVDFNGFGDSVGIDPITYDDVVVAIKELKSASTIGIDNIPPFIIKGCDEFLVYPPSCVV
ncbi:hypothetical protein AVEN_158901-1 [Araneus ventricosus]|uniref:Uncharacterized protein n=1 Tax=Araneus ventricosus TaxID=182803 RepID=A0A4Y2B9R2_ARAVE|nr:hypothetical protein AVEN_158901-1 [Araneus ventricosus]